MPTTNYKNCSMKILARRVGSLAERWTIILKVCSMLGDTYNAKKNVSIIYLGLLVSGLAVAVGVSVSCTYTHNYIQ